MSSAAASDLLGLVLSGKGALLGVASLLAYSLIGAYFTENAYVLRYQFYQGVKLTDLWKMLVRIRFCVHPFYWVRFIHLFLTSLWQTRRADIDLKKYGDQISKLRLP
eukprot:27968_5